MKRRGFLIGLAAVGGGALVLGWASGRPDLDGSAELFNLVPGETALNGWVRISADGVVTVAVPRAELGQGASSVLAAMVAEELDVPWDMIRTELPPQAAVYANTTMLIDGMALLPNAERGHWAQVLRQLAANGMRELGLIGTGGSTSVRDGWLPMRTAGAAARSLLLQAAAKKWQVDVGSCTSSAGRIVHAASGRALGYGELAPAAAKLSIGTPPQLREMQAWRLLGHAFARLDIPAKVSGKTQFGIDVQVPQGLYAAVRMAPVFGAEIRSLSAQNAERAKGVRAVVRLTDAVAVVADQWWQAQRALDLLQISFTTPAEAVSEAALRGRYLELAANGAAHTHETRGDQQAARHAEGAQLIEADYHLPWLAHAALEPMNCTARVSDGVCEVWMGHQIPTLLRWFAASAAGVSADRVIFHSAPVGGSFGRRLEIDLVVQAVTIAAHHPGTAIKLLWTREDDTRHDVYRPMALVRQRVALDGGGLPLSWYTRVVTPSIMTSVMGRLLPLAASDHLPDKTAVDGAIESPYALPALRIEHVPAPAGVPVGFWRSVGHSINAFAAESMIDELAHAAKQDPLAYRRRLLSGESRHLALLQAAAQAADWTSPLPAGSGRGLALHASFGSIVAMVIEIDTRGSQIVVRRITAAVDCGVALDPDTVRAQVEGGALFGLGAALYGRIHVDDGRVRNGNFDDYPVLRMADTPIVEVLMIDTPGAAIGGIGEVGVPPVAPALANAVFAATGRRLRTLPLSLVAAPT